MIVYLLRNFSISVSISTFIMLESFLVLEPFLVFDPFGLNKSLFIILLSIILKFSSLFGLLILYLFKKPSYLSFSILIDTS